MVTHRDGHINTLVRTAEGVVCTDLPVLTTRPFTMTRECRSWVSTPGTDAVPFTESWNCAGCSRYPTDLVEQQQHRFLNRHRGREPHPTTSSGG